MTSEEQTKAMEVYTSTMEAIDGLNQQQQMWLLLTWTKHILGNMSLVDNQWVHLGRFSRNCKKFSEAVQLLGPAINQEWVAHKHES